MGTNRKCFNISSFFVFKFTMKNLFIKLSSKKSSHLVDEDHILTRHLFLRITGVCDATFLETSVHAFQMQLPCNCSLRISIFTLKNVFTVVDSRHIFWRCLSKELLWRCIFMVFHVGKIKKVMMLTWHQSFFMLTKVKEFLFSPYQVLMFKFKYHAYF